MSSADPVLIHPYTAYDNAEEFFNNFAQMSIPLMGDYEIQVVPDKAADGITDNVCFKSAIKTVSTMSATVLSLALLAGSLS